MNSWLRRNAGFTLVELVTILVMVGILAAFAAPRFVDNTGFESRGFFDQAQATVRYAQKLAISQRQSPPKPPVFVVIGANNIRACYDAACATPVINPANGAALAVNAPGNVTLAPVTQLRRPRSHWDMILERRSRDELQDLLNERLQVLRGTPRSA